VGYPLHPKNFKLMTAAVASDSKTEKRVPFAVSFLAGG
jgi:hypothetical protein